MRWCSILAAAFCLAPLTFAGCGGAPKHDGYKTRTQRPWQKPKVIELELDEDEDQPVYEGRTDGVVDYPRRRRARWYAVDLPEHGDLTVRLNVQAPDTEDDSEREIDIAFEVLDPRYNALETVDRESDDAGDLKKKRELGGLAPGRYYIHVYAQERKDAAEFSLRFSFTSKSAKYKSDFPANVAFIGVLAQVPAFDDTPIAKKPKKPRRPRRPGRPKPVAKPSGKRGRIAGISSRPNGTSITINLGRRHGIDKGWRGSVITGGGKRVANGSFTVSKVTETQSYATVRASQDTVTNAKYVRLSPP